MTSTDGLFRSIRIGSMELANWIVMPLIMHSFAPNGFAARRIPRTTGCGRQASSACSTDLLRLTSVK